MNTTRWLIMIKFICTYVECFQSNAKCIKKFSDVVWPGNVNKCVIYLLARCAVCSLSMKHNIWEGEFNFFDIFCNNLSFN